MQGTAPNPRTRRGADERNNRKDEDIMLKCQTRSLARILTATSLLVPLAMGHAATTTWEGDLSSNTGSNGNWTDGKPGRPDKAVFDDPTAPGLHQPDVGTGTLELTEIVFNNAGWHLSVDQPNGGTIKWN